MTTRVSVMALAGCLVITQLSFASDEIELRVTIGVPTIPSGVTIQRENSVSQTVLSREPTGTVYTVSVIRPTAKELSAAKLLSYPYRLVATWDDGKEPLYLAFSSRSLAKIDIPILHPNEPSERTTLDSIETLGSDFTSTLEKYFRSRAFHRKWRLENKLPYHQVAVRSAKIWFDASANLAKLADSYFRIDEEVQEIIIEYERKAASDPWFRTLYKKYATAGYISATLEQIYAGQFQFVGEIPKLVANQRLNEAQDLNDTAIAVLESESQNVRQVVSKRQGVNLELLKANSEYISTMQRNK